VKGISPLLAAVFLIISVLAIASLTLPFFMETTQNAQTGQQQQQQQAIDISQASIEIQEMIHNNDTGQFNATLQNAGSVTLSNFTIAVYGDRIEQKRFNRTLHDNQINVFQMDIGSSEGLETVSVSVVEPPIEVEKAFSKAHSGSQPDSPTGLTIS